MKTKTNTSTFKVTSGKVVLGDPCYETNPSYPAVNGPWTSHVVTTEGSAWGRRVKKIVVHYVDFNPADPKIRSFREDFSVDSGQAGVFDLGSYGVDDFYDLCCKKTLSRQQYGYLKSGFVTSSGYGDGFYGAEIHTVGGKAVCIELEFIED